MRAYLDHASASPLRPEVASAIRELVGVAQADPGRAYAEALVVRELIEEARRQVAGLARATPRQVTFTASIAESNATAISGLADGRPIYVAATDRQSSLDAARRAGGLVELAVEPDGALDLDALDAQLAVAPGLVSCQLANHETGALTDPAELVELVRRRGSAIHLDAATAFGHVEVDLGALDLDAATITGEMIGGPMGSAGLLVRKGRPFPALIAGGSQERGRRAGLEGLLGIVGFGVACESARASLQPDAERARRLIAEIEAAALAIEGVSAVGPVEADRRAPQLRCFVIEGVEAEPVLLGLDRAGVAVHSGSACSSESLEPSPVLAAMGLDADRSLRASVGWSSTDADVAAFAAAFGPVVDGLRRLRS